MSDPQQGGVFSRTNLLVAAGVLGALVAAFCAGRFSAPVNVETRDVEHVVYKDRVVEKVVTVAAEAKVETRVVYLDRVVTKEGTVTEHWVEREASKDDTTTRTEGTRAEEKAAEKVVERTTTVTVRPDWRVSIQAGASLRAPLVPIYGPVVVGLEVDRRLFGGVSAGVWASSTGAAGIAVSLEF